MHLTEIIKGVRSEVHLCEQCAREIGLNSKLSSYSLSVPDMISYLDEDGEEKPAGAVCRFCGITSADMESTGKAGCVHCFEAFAGEIEELCPEIRTQYAGKHPSGKENVTPIRSEPQPETGNALLRKQLEEAVRDERYEDAARIRDLIAGRA